MPQLIKEDAVIRRMIMDRFKSASVSWVGIERAGLELLVGVEDEKPRLLDNGRIGNPQGEHCRKHEIGYDPGQPPQHRAMLYERPDHASGPKTLEEPDIKRITR